MRSLRILWVVLAVVVLGLNAASIPFTYAEASSVCTLDAEVCFEEGLLTPEDARELRELGIFPELEAAYSSVVLPTVVTLVFFAVAAVIFSRRSDDRMALFAAFMLLLFGGATVAGTTSELADVHPAFWFPVRLLEYLGSVTFGVFFYLFPDGRFAPRWTRWLALASAFFFVPYVFFPDSVLGSLLESLFYVLVGTLVVAQVYRYRRVSTPEQRQQTKWVVFGFAAGLTGFLAVISLFVFVSAVRGSALGQIFAVTLIWVFVLLIPLGIGMAILRSRLYDIDVVINRALVYGLLTATLVLIYLGGVVGLQYAFRTLTGSNSQLAIVASTLTIAALFVPLRRRVQALIDRRFYRQKYDARKTLEDFSARLREQTDLDGLSAQLLTVTRETMQPEHVVLWLRPTSGGGLGSSEHTSESTPGAQLPRS